MRSLAETPALGDVPVEAARTAATEEALRIAHYSGYPRVSKGQRVRMAVARRATGSAMSLVASEGEDVGALLLLKVSDLGGPPAGGALARVVSCSALEDGRFDLELALVEPHTPRFVRREPESLRIPS